MSSILIALTLAASPDALAQDEDSDYGSLDDPGSKKKKKKPIDEEEEGSDEVPGRRSPKEDIVREIERGFYAKSALGTTVYLLNYGPLGAGTDVLRSGTAISLAVGQEFVDNEKNSMAWEVALAQGVHNGMHWEENSLMLCLPTCAIQGDTRTFSGLVGIEYSLYPSRRFGVGVRVGGGVMIAPLLMYSEAYTRDVARVYGFDLTVHKTPHPLGYGGPTFEYYTKLSHFSVGADVDVSYAVFFDLGVSATGYMKYSF
jgi:hypothetical protein